MSRTLLWVGDAVVHTGFARVTHNILRHLKTMGWNIVVLGINYDGDPHKYDYPIYPASRGQDVWGVGRLKYVCKKDDPDVILVLNDPWNIPPYLAELGKDGPPVVAYMPVDAPNQLAGSALGRLHRGIAYTNFGRRELMMGGYMGRCDVIGHGVDTSMYYPVEREAAREKLAFGRALPKDAFIVGNVNRNQPRKRLDLSIQYFAQWWVNRGQPRHTFLYLHCGNRDLGWNVIQLARYYGIEKQLILSNPNMTTRNSLVEEDMRFVYSAFDVQINTGLGEGWGLTNHEGMACGIPQIVGQYAALAEWAEGGVRYVPCTTFAAAQNGINTIGGIPDMQGFLDALDDLYDHPERRAEIGEAGRRLATDSKYKWSNLAKQFDTVLTETIEETTPKSPMGIKEAQRGSQVPQGT